MNILNKIKSGKSDGLYEEIVIEASGYSIREFFYEICQGKSEQDILLENPNITKEDILICYNYAMELIGVIDFNLAKKSISEVINKRIRIAQKLRTTKMPDSWKNFDNLK